MEANMKLTPKQMIELCRQGKAYVAKEVRWYFYTHDGYMQRISPSTAWECQHAENEAERQRA